MPGLKLTVPDPVKAVQAALQEAGIAVVETRPISHGFQVRGAAGEIVNVYATGSVVPQGQNTAGVIAAIQAAQRMKPPLSQASKPKARTTAPRGAIKVAVQEAVEEPYTPRVPVGWKDNWDDWDGVSPPWDP
jgi:predicted nucleotide-binding protein